MFGLSPGEPCKNGWSDPDAVCINDSGGLRKHLLHIADRIGRIRYCVHLTQSQPSSCFWNYVITSFLSCYSASIVFTLWRVLTMFMRSAITPPEVKRFGWKLGRSEYIVCRWPLQGTHCRHLSNYSGDASYVKQEIRSVEHGICPIAEFISPCLHCAHSNRIPYPVFCWCRDVHLLLKNIKWILKSH